MKFTDTADADGVPLQGAALFAARAEHPLEWEAADQQAVWQAALPELVFNNINGVFSTDVYGLARAEGLRRSAVVEAGAPDLACW